MNWLSFQLCFPFLFWVFIGHVWRQRPSLIPLCPPPSLQPQGEKRGGGKRCEGRKHLCPIKCNCHKDDRHPAPANSQLTPWPPKYLLSYLPWVFTTASSSRMHAEHSQSIVRSLPLINMIVLALPSSICKEVKINKSNMWWLRELSHVVKEDRKRIWDLGLKLLLRVWWRTLGGNCQVQKNGTFV